MPAAERKPGSFFFASSFPGRRVLSPSPGLSRLSCSLTLSTLCPALCLPRQLLLLLINLLSFAPPPHQTLVGTHDERNKPSIRFPKQEPFAPLGAAWGHRGGPSGQAVWIWTTPANRSENAVCMHKCQMRTTHAQHLSCSQLLMNDATPSNPSKE